MDNNVGNNFENMDDKILNNTVDSSSSVVVKSNVSSKSKKVEKKNGNNGSNAGVILIVSILLSFVCGAVGAYLITSNVSVKQVVKNITTSELVETSISSSVDKVYGSTVIIIAYKDDKKISTGTGFVYKKDKKNAYIMTNNHVIDNADRVEVEFNDKREKIEAKILGGEVYSDIAVLTIDVNKAADEVEVGNTKDIKLGDTIFTVGSPMGEDYKGTVTKGIVSGKDRMIEVNLTGNVSDYYMKVIQIDAAVNPGNSGGPLCDVSGKVVGIISLKIVKDEVEGMGFAIPIEDALEYANAIEEGGEIVRPYIGISMIDLTDEYTLWQNKIIVPDGVTEGIAVVEVVDGSPADKAGFKKGDIIVKLADEEVGNLAEFRYELYTHKVGDKLKVEYYRNGKLKTTTITLGKNED